MPLKSTFKRNKNSTSSKGPPEEEAAISIGEPFNIKRHYHVTFDNDKGEFIGFPESWENFFMSSDISKTEQEQNPEAVVSSLKTYTASINKKGHLSGKCMMVTTTIRESDELLESGTDEERSLNGSDKEPVATDQGDALVFKEGRTIVIPDAPVTMPEEIDDTDRHSDVADNCDHPDSPLRILHNHDSTSSVPSPKTGSTLLAPTYEQHSLPSSVRSQRYRHSSPSSNNHHHNRQSLQNTTCLKTNDYFNIIGQSIGWKLRRLENKQRIFAERLIHEVIFKAEMGSLDMNVNVTSSTQEGCFNNSNS